MLCQIRQTISDIDKYPDFKDYYQDYIKSLQDAILEVEVKDNSSKMSHLKSLNKVISQLNVLTEELKTL